MSAKVAMVHPDLEKTKEKPKLVEGKSFKAVWEGRGWKLAPKKDQPNTEESK